MKKDMTAWVRDIRTGSMKSYVLFRIGVLGFMLAMILTGCGGGSDNNSKSSSNWDQMVWDQDNWN